MANKNQVNVLLKDAEWKALQECAALLKQKPSSIARQIITDNVFAFKERATIAAAILNEPRGNHSASKSKPKTVVPKKLRN